MELREQLIVDAARAEAATKCKNRGCAARAVSSLFSIVNFNGPTLTCDTIRGGCGCVHAEQLMVCSVLQLKQTGVTALVTLSPCTACANLIVASEAFIAVKYLYEYSDRRGIEILRGAGISVEKV